MSPIFSYLGRKFVKRPRPSFLTIRGRLYRPTCAEICFVVLMAFLSCVFSPRSLAIQDLSGQNARIAVATWRGFCFPLPRNVHDFVRGNKLKSFVKGTQIDLVLSLLVKRRLKELNCAFVNCLGRYHYEF